MKKIIISTLFGIILLASFVLADTVNMNISVNGTANLNVTVNADDSLARAAINQTQNDVYGTMTGSGPRDLVLDEITRGVGNPVNGTEDLNAIKEICNDPYLQNYLSQIGSLPPKEFADYVKALGYDDEAHINFIWIICQQEYIKKNEGTWSTDLIGGGIQQGDLFTILKAAVDWLKGGGDTVYTKAKDIGMVLDSYFASDKDVWFLSNKINQLELRIEALERTVEKTSSEEYCQSKIAMMKDYNMTSVKCGTNSTVYWNAKKQGFDNYDTISYNSCTEDWLCVKWSDCNNGTQTRKCVDKNDCGTFYNKPSESIDCIVSEQKEVKSTVAEKPKTETPTKQVLSNNYLSKINLSILIVTVALISLALGFYKNLRTKEIISSK